MKLQKQLLFAGLFFTLSFIAVLLFTYSSPPQYSSLDIWTLLLLLLVYVFVENYMLQLKGFTISFASAIAIAVFLEYGLVTELWLTLIAAIIIAFVERPRRKIYRTLISMAMFIWMSIFAAGAYYAINGTEGFKYNELSSLGAALAYAAVYFIVNHMIMHVVLYFSDRRNHLSDWDNIKWDFYSSLIALPLGVLLYVVYDIMGIKGIVFVSVPVIAISYIFKLYNDLHATNQKLKSLSTISTAFTSELDMNEALTSFQDALDNMIDYDQCFIHVFDEESGELETLLAFDREIRFNEKKLQQTDCFKSGTALAQHVIKTGTSIIVNKRSDMAKQNFSCAFDEETEAMICVPMRWQDKVIGALTLMSKQEYTYKQRYLNVIQILASQTAVAIHNAKQFAVTEKRSKTDDLTGLYNYRTFDQLLHETVREAENRENKVSLIILDIDYFKSVNDTHGHLAGNEVLQHIARILEQNVRKDDIVARYGGEEFTVILPNADSETAEVIAERIRSEIHRSPFRVQHSIGGKGEVLLQVTVSIGIATFPDYADSALSLVRHADRAMYIGSKRGGRNRVSVYQAG